MKHSFYIITLFMLLMVPGFTGSGNYVTQLPVGLPALKDSAQAAYNRGDYKKSRQVNLQIKALYEKSGLKEADSIAKYYLESTNALIQYSPMDKKEAHSFIAKYGNAVTNKDYIAGLYNNIYTSDLNFAAHNNESNYKILEDYVRANNVSDKAKYNMYMARAYDLSYYGEPAVAMSYLKKSDSLAVMIFKNNKKKLAIHYFNTASSYYSLNNLYEALRLAEKAEVLFKEIYQPDHMNMGQLYNLLGNLREALGYSVEASNYFEKAYQVFNLNDYGRGKAMVDFNNSTSQLSLGHSEASDLLLERYKSAFNDDYPMEAREEAYYLGSKGLYYIYKGDFRKADSLGKLSLQMLKAIFGEVNVETAQAYHGMGILKMYEKKWDEAIRYFDKNRDIYKQLGRELEEYWTASLKKADCMLRSGRTQEAIDLYTTYLQVESADFQHTYDRRIAGVVGLANAYKQAGEETKALAVLDSAMAVSLFSITGKKNTLNSYELDLSKLYCDLSYKLDPGEKNARFILDQIADINTKESDQLFTISNPLDYSSRQEIITDLNNLAIKIASSLYKQTAEPGLISDIIQFAANANTGQLAQNDFIRDILLKKYRDSTAYEALIRIRAESKYLEGFSEVDQIKDSIDLVRYNALTAKENAWKAKYPEYYSIFKYQHAVDGNDVIRLLDRADASLVAFLTIDSVYYGFHLKGNAYQFARLDSIRKVNNQIHSFLDQIKLRAPVSNLAGSLYNELLRPLGSLDRENIVLVPQGGLWNLCFDALEAQPGRPLVMDHIIQYATRVPEEVDLRAADKPFVSIAPGFDQKDGRISTTLGANSQLARTPWSLELSHFLESTYQAINFNSEKATRKNVMSQLDKAGTVHFSTHASFDEQLPQNSTLYMTREEDNIQARDIYPLQLHARLISLIGCETGAGKQQVTEGNKSLANAFLFAGAKNVIQTLWKIDDKESNVLIREFYKNYFDAGSIPQSLRNAKIAYITEAKGRLKHPYYWAGIIPISNKMDVTGAGITAWIIGGFLLVLAGGLFYFIRRK